MTDGVNYENNSYDILMNKEKCNEIEVNQEEELKWNEKSASFYIIMYFFTYNLKY